MLTVRKAQERGHADHGWLKSYHTFSFANYFDPQHMNFRALRVINEDRVKPGQGFGTHPHRDMEIISYVVSGALEHRDSMGTGSVIRPGDVQVMSAGSGVTHSEFNHSDSEIVHFLQIWIMPNEHGGQSGYQQQHFEPEQLRGGWQLLVGPQGSKAPLSIKADAQLYGAVLGASDTITVENVDGRGKWLQVVRGAVSTQGQIFAAGDGLAMEGLEIHSFTSESDSELLLFDLG